MSNKMTSMRTMALSRIVFLLALPAAVVLFAGSAAGANEGGSHPKLDEATIFTSILRKEIAASHLTGKRVCVGLNNGEDPPKRLLNTFAKQRPNISIAQVDIARFKYGNSLGIAGL